MKLNYFFYPLFLLFMTFAGEAGQCNITIDYNCPHSPNGIAINAVSSEASGSIMVGPGSSGSFSVPCSFGESQYEICAGYSATYPEQTTAQHIDISSLDLIKDYYAGFLNLLKITNKPINCALPIKLKGGVITLFSNSNITLIFPDSFNLSEAEIKNCTFNASVSPQ